MIQRYLNRFSFVPLIPLFVIVLWPIQQRTYNFNLFILQKGKIAIFICRVLLFRPAIPTYRSTHSDSNARTIVHFVLTNFLEFCQTNWKMVWKLCRTNWRQTKLRATHYSLNVRVQESKWHNENNEKAHFCHSFSHSIANYFFGQQG